MVHAQTPAAALRENLAFTESDVLITGVETEVEVLSDIRLLICVDISGIDFDFDCTDRLNSDGTFFCEPIKKIVARVPELSGEDIAPHCAIYMNSSGTTGTAKTVLLSHEAINRMVENLNDIFRGEVLSEQVALSVSPLYHSLGFIAEMHRAISCGAKLVMLERWNRDLVIELIESQAINFMTGVPSMYLDLVRCSDFNSGRVSSLRYCFVGGDSITWDLIEAIDERVGGRRVAFSVYGMTEVGSAACALTPEHDRKNASGFPLKDASIAVVDDAGVLSLSGKGELVISSAGMMLGYLKDPQTTDHVLFVQNGRKWIHTGDYGEVDEDGFVYYIARLKNVIMRKGYCVFPNDVEKAIRACAFVRDVCVLGLPDIENHTEKVCAAIVLKSEIQIEDARKAIEKACCRELPRYSVPAVLHFLEHIPYTQIGKVDREALRERLCSEQTAK